MNKSILKQLISAQINLEGQDVSYYDVYLIKGTEYLTFVSNHKQDQKSNLGDEYIYIGRLNVIGNDGGHQIKPMLATIEALI